MFRIALRLVACLVLVMLIAPQVVDAQGRGGNTKPQLLVTKAVADSPVKFICMGGGPKLPFGQVLLRITVSGQNFGGDPEAFLGNDQGGLDQLTLCGPAVSPNTVVFGFVCPNKKCKLGQAPGPGNYLLVVTRGPSATDVYNFNVTVSAEAEDPDCPNGELCKKPQ